MFNQRELEIIELEMTNKIFKIKDELLNSKNKVTSPDFISGLESYLREIEEIRRKITGA